MGIQKLAFCYDFEQRKIIRGETIYLIEKIHVIQRELTFLLTPFILSFPGI